MTDIVSLTPDDAEDWKPDLAKIDQKYKNADGTVRNDTPEAAQEAMVLASVEDRARREHSDQKVVDDIVDYKHERKIIRDAMKEGIKRGVHSARYDAIKEIEEKTGNSHWDVQ